MSSGEASVKSTKCKSTRQTGRKKKKKQKEKLVDEGRQTARRRGGTRSREMASQIEGTMGEKVRMQVRSGSAKQSSKPLTKKKRALNATEHTGNKIRKPQTRNPCKTHDACSQSMKKAAESANTHKHTYIQTYRHTDTHTQKSQTHTETPDHRNK